MAAEKKTSNKGRKSSTARSRTPASDQSVWQRHRRDLWILALVVVGFFVLFAETGLLGPTGDVINTALSTSLGVGRFALTFIFLGLAVASLWDKVDVDRRRLVVGVPLGLMSVGGFADMARGNVSFSADADTLGGAGGWIGCAIGGGLHHVVGVAGTLVVLGALAVVAIMVLTGISLGVIVRWIWSVVRSLGRAVASLFASASDDDSDEVVIEPVTSSRRRRADPPLEEFPVQTVEEYDESLLQVDDVPDDESRDVEVPPSVPEPTARRKKASAGRMKGTWKLPDPAILQRIKEQKQDRSAIDAAGDELVDALAAHGVETTLVGYTIGPTVTRYELELGAGVKVAKVTSLNRDIAYAMASPDVRILAPIPGRSAIGVEVPNRQRTLVTLGDLLAAEEAVQATHPLDVPLGRDISGTTVVVNLAAMPHVLISGATGAGKSSCINSLISSLVMRSTPDEVRLILVDPKRVELGQYNDLPHLLTPVVVDPRKAAGALAWAVREMERRYDILAEAGVRDITSYKEMLTRSSAGEASEDPVADDSDEASAMPSEREDFPYIVIVVDELNDLMMVAARDVEESVVRIAQMARAVGIHLVLATQRPSVDVITGVIKANVPSRMAFAVSSLADSRVILDQAGAERLIGKGDMLLLTASSNVPRRLQSPWISEDEVRQLVAAWTSQDGQVELVAELDASVGGGEGGFGNLTGDEDDDEMLRQARDLVIRTQSGSVSMLQRKLRVGFARAGRLMDMLENEGTVAAGEGSKSRQVLVTLEEYEARQRLL